jgi:CheY-like chemotaxis protein
VIETETPPPESLDALTYLVVDDDDLSRRTFKKFLTHLGAANVIEAESAGQALALIAAHRIDVLITDLKMPDIAGDELVWCLRRSPDGRLRRLPVVMISAYHDEKHARAARDAGVDEFTTKPCSLGDFYLYVHRAVTEPRSFVAAPDYKGPDRRRKDTGAPEGQERRVAAAPPTAH